MVAAVEIVEATRRFTSRTHPDGLIAYQEVTCTIEEGQFCCLLGPSGCGKSSLLNAIAGLDLGFVGSVSVLGKDVATLQRSSGATGATIGYVFQEPRLLPWRTVEENLEFALQSTGLRQAEQKRRISLWLERVGLASFGSAYPHELSGGMQQRAAIARAFVVEPDILLMDEPFSGLDEFTARSMREHLLAIWEETKKTIVFVTHNCFEAAYLATRVLVMTPRPGRLAYDEHIDVPRPRSYDDPKLFERSVELTNQIMWQTQQSA